MGGSLYSQENRSTRTLQFNSMQKEEIFSKKLHKDMNPFGVTIRESRDSENHPLSLPIILALDVTGSMGHIPEMLIKSGLPHIISSLVEAGIADPQIMFIAIGDHICDTGPLQISQFESGDAELDMWLTRVWLESGGGGNGGESYSLAHYFAAKHTVTDHWEKRGQRGFLFTIGDERNHPSYPASAIKSLMGVSEASNYSSSQLIQEAGEKWNIFHILPGMEKDNSFSQWKETLGENALFVHDATEIPNTITKLIVSMVDNSVVTAPVKEETTINNQVEDKPSDHKEFL